MVRALRSRPPPGRYTSPDYSANGSESPEAKILVRAPAKIKTPKLDLATITRKEPPKVTAVWKSPWFVVTHIPREKQPVDRRLFGRKRGVKRTKVEVVRDPQNPPRKRQRVDWAARMARSPRRSLRTSQLIPLSDEPNMDDSVLSIEQPDLTPTQSETTLPQDMLLDQPEIDDEDVPNLELDPGFDSVSDPKPEADIDDALFPQLEVDNHELSVPSTDLTPKKSPQTSEQDFFQDQTRIDTRDLPIRQPDLSPQPAEGASIVPESIGPPLATNMTEDEVEMPPIIESPELFFDAVAEQQAALALQARERPPICSPPESDKASERPLTPPPPLPPPPLNPSSPPPSPNALTPTSLPPPFLPFPKTPPAAVDRAAEILAATFAPIGQPHRFITALTSHSPGSRSTATLLSLALNTQKALQAWQDEYIRLDKRTAPAALPFPKKPATGGRHPAEPARWEEEKEKELFGEGSLLALLRPNARGPASSVTNGAIATAPAASASAAPATTTVPAPKPSTEGGRELRRRRADAVSIIDGLGISEDDAGASREGKRARKPVRRFEVGENGDNGRGGGVGGIRRRRRRGGGVAAASVGSRGGYHGYQSDAGHVDDGVGGGSAAKSEGTREDARRGGRSDRQLYPTPKRGRVAALLQDECMPDNRAPVLYGPIRTADSVPVDGNGAVVTQDGFVTAGDRRHYHEAPPLQQQQQERLQPLPQQQQQYPRHPLQQHHPHQHQQSRPAPPPQPHHNPHTNTNTPSAAVRKSVVGGTHTPRSAPSHASGGGAQPKTRQKSERRSESMTAWWAERKRKAAELKARELKERGGVIEGGVEGIMDLGLPRRVGGGPAPGMGIGMGVAGGGVAGMGVGLGLGVGGERRGGGR